jgi:hypothetical protein
MDYQWSRFHRSTGARSLVLVKPARKKSRLRYISQSLTAAVLLTLTGCTLSTTRHGWPGSYAPAGVPNAQDCVPIHWGQPTDFACPGGKVYSARELKSLREEKAKTAVASAGY